MPIRLGPIASASTSTALLIAVVVVCPTRNVFADPGGPVAPQRSPAPTDPRTLEEATAAADAEVAAARERFETMQRLSEEHAQATADATAAFQERMKAARTPEERRAIQETFQRERHEREAELKRRLTELGGR
ncbi:MAG: hypothetical protein R3F35_12820 [Myxococcota bacterium]